MVVHWLETTWKWLHTGTASGERTAPNDQGDADNVAEYNGYNHTNNNIHSGGKCLLDDEDDDDDNDDEIDNTD